MLLSEALFVLGLTSTAICDESVIKRTWKQKMRESHPDKNLQASASATADTQRLNEAKDTLLQIFHDRHEQKRREDEEERLMRDKQKHREDEMREKKRAETEAKKKEDDDHFKKYCDDMYNKAQAIRHERQIRNRKKRLPTARVHKKICEYQEGKDLVEEMQKFFSDKYTNAANNVLLVSEILDLFVKSRDSTSVLEINLFKRHAKKLFLAAWPKSAYSSSKNKRCFRHVGVR